MSENDEFFTEILQKNLQFRPTKALFTALNHYFYEQKCILGDDYASEYTMSQTIRSLLIEILRKKGYKF